MTTTELIKILQDNEKGGISHKSRDISLVINGRYMPNPQISLSCTGDGICGPEIDLDIEGDWFEQQPRWIPVSERLPNDEDYVLVCYEDGHIRTAYYYIDTNIYPPEFEDCCETGWYNYNEDFMYEQDVVAWMSLPQPYAESEDKE